MARLVAFTPAGRAWPGEEGCKLQRPVVPSCGQEAGVPQGLRRPVGPRPLVPPRAWSLRTKTPGSPASWSQGVSLHWDSKVTFEVGTGRTFRPLWVCV